ncbi:MULTISPECIES: DUF4397 domain-containing protein [unclassified Pedobacter]|uniref:DUF4397 domain-containing protein n=1 Tax=Pedobacter TaxID=84567 RepID=UPI000B4AB11F|nr:MULTISPECIES: DUF4397 domain-containing protein [unclassified Pedobacter]MCX2429202.1 DUF4397 domain-containing protein [Pedobacter sp. GR22-10]OWK71137.1 hypothetical protein CBW18_08670 [Pedobacter sp. AJM]
MKRHSALFFILFACLILTSLFSCKKADPNVEVKGESKVKLVNAIQANAVQDIFIDDEKLSNSALAFSESTDYMKLVSGSRDIKFIGDNHVETKASIKYTPSITYTTFLISNRSGAKEIVSYEDNLSNTESGKAKIKLISLTPYFTTGINVSVQAGTLFVNGLQYKESSTYFSVDADLNLRYNVVGSGTVKTIDNSNFQAGKIYTIWFSGNTAASLTAHVITDN